MSGYTEWRRLWDEVNAAMDEYGTAQARETSRFLKRIRKAVASYGWMVDPTSFDEFGEIIEPEEVAE